MIEIKKEPTGRIFNIQKYSIHDGSGVRTLVFFKGCPLRCLWCSNPEGIKFNFDVMKSADRCNGCGKCAAVCPNNILTLKTDVNGETKIHVNRELSCIGCKKCQVTCPSHALEIAGVDKTVKQIMDVVLQDALFYFVSGGGLTLGGGEVTAQGEFAVSLLKEAKEQGINTAIETCGQTTKSNLENFAKYTDTFLFDLKSMDSYKHEQLVGVSNGRILENLKHLFDIGAKVSVRMPLIKGLNDSEQELTAAMNYIKSISQGKNLVSVDLLPYHKYGVKKYEKLDLKYPLMDFDLSYNSVELDALEVRMAQVDLPIKLLRH